MPARVIRLATHVDRTDENEALVRARFRALDASSSWEADR